MVGCYGSIERMENAETCVLVVSPVLGSKISTLENIRIKNCVYRSSKGFLSSANPEEPRCM